MKSWGEIILVQYNLASRLCNLLERTLQKSCYWRFSGCRLRPSRLETLAWKAGVFDPELETPAKESSLLNSFFTRVVQVSVAGSESLRTPAGDSDACYLGSGDSGPYRLENPGGTGDSDPYRPETPGLVDSNG
jgi:hypothetical protein